MHRDDESQLCSLAVRMPEEAEMHDRWVGLLAAALGAAEPVAEPTMLYRQHARNVVGSTQANASLRGLASRTQQNGSRRAERLKSEHQVRALLRLHGAQLSPARRSTLEAYLRSGESESAWSRVGITLRHGFTARGCSAARLRSWTCGEHGPQTDGCSPI